MRKPQPRALGMFLPVFFSIGSQMAHALAAQLNVAQIRQIATCRSRKSCSNKNR
jgi:hypothetical protein